MATTKTQPTTEEVTARGIGLPISTKFSIEICREIRHKPLTRAEHILEDAISKTRAIPFKRFVFDLGHKSGMAAARYPIATSEHILRLVHLLKANAEHKGFNPEKLVISFAKANRGDRRYHNGRHRGTKMKNTHIELRAREQEVKK